jgi:hypothetical protein
MLKNAKTENEIKLKGIEALNKLLGPADALKFLTYMHREPTDYVKVSHNLYKGQSIEDIFNRSKSNWKK